MNNASAGWKNTDTQQYFKDACISNGLSRSGSSKSPYICDKICFRVISDDHSLPNSATQTLRWETMIQRSHNTKYVCYGITYLSLLRDLNGEQLV
jgi:hypothetical protein